MSSERKRRRPAVSCILCRRKKQRCNRETPCSNCVRSRNPACVYETEVPKLSSAISTTSSISGDAPTTTTLDPGSSQSSFELEAMKARIVELEEKLSQAGNSTTASVCSIATSSPAGTHAVQTVTSFAGTIDVLQDSRALGRAHAISRSIAHKNRVFGQSHWMNGFIVFRDIIEMVEPNLRSRSSTILANIHRAKVLARVIKSQRSPSWPTPPTKELPPKYVCDTLVNGYLRTMETVYRVLHIPSFKKDYEALWVSDTEASTPFVIQLKLVLAIGAILYDERFSMRTEATRWIYEAQTWLSSPLFKSRLGIQYLQTNILLLLARELANVGAELVWISAGSIFRAAVYIGLHKDPTQLHWMAVFESEMRRRIWNTILEISLQASLESGGSCFISLEDFNTEPPGNFDDEQLKTVDPIASPETVYTQTSAAVAMRRTFPTRLAVVKFLNDIGSTGTFEETLRTDTELRAGYKSLRRELQVYATSATSSPLPFTLQAADFIMQRYITSLHVPFFGPSLRDPVYAYSRKAVVDSSLKIWTLANPAPVAGSAHTMLHSSTAALNAASETDLARLSRCGSGFFRMFAFHASTFLGIEARTLVEDGEDDIGVMSSQSDLFSIDNAAKWYLRCMEAGETGMKGYLLLKLLAAQVDAIKRHVDKTEMPALLAKAAEEAAKTSLLGLEAAAGQDHNAAALDGVDKFDFQVSPEFMEDWDLVMSDVFNFGSGEHRDWSMSDIVF